MTIVDSLSLFVIMLTLAMLPSTSVALVVTRSAALGFSNGAAVSMGIVLGDLIFVLLAVFGLTALSQLMGTFFLVIKYIAAAYLIWFGLNLLKSKTSINFQMEQKADRGSLLTSFVAGLFLTLGDIKAIFFYASLFPAFVDLSILQLVDIIIIMLITAMTVGGVKLLYAFFANKVVAVSKGREIQKPVLITSGSLMVGTGVYLITKN